MMEYPDIDCIVCDDGFDLVKVGSCCTNCGRERTDNGMIHDPDKGSEPYRKNRARLSKEFKEFAERLND